MEYVPIRVSTLRGDQKIDFNLFIKIGGKQVLYIRRGDSFEGERLEKLRNKKLKKMFIIEEDELNYRNYISKNLEMAFDPKTKKSLKDRCEIIQGSQQGNAEALMENPEDKTQFQITRFGINKYIDFILNQGDAFKAMLDSSKNETGLASHCLNVSTISIALAHRLGITNARDIEHLALGALIHDIGLMHIDVDLNTPLHSLTPEQLKIYKTHPDVGTDKVNGLEHIEQPVLKIICEHEETIDGSGYPRGLREFALHPLSVIVGSANRFDRLVSFENMDSESAIKKVFIDSIGLHPIEHLKHIQNLVKTGKI